MPRVAVIFTGGTISMAFDAAAGGNTPRLDGAAILARTPGLEDLADVVAIDRGLTPASHFGVADLLRLSADIKAAAADPGVDGIVLVQGTDTIEETAFAWDLLHAGPKPVVVTGAMRASHEPPDDGPSNLRDAVRLAAAPTARDLGVLVSLAGTVEAADDVVKMHTTALDTFRSPNGGSLARVDADGVLLLRPRGPRRALRVAEGAPVRGRVHLVTAGVGTDGALLDAAVRSGADGIVVAATGSGNTAPALLEAAERAMAADIPVVLASRCPAGAVGTAYAFPGGGATWVRAGALTAGTLCAIKARIALLLALTAGLDRPAIAALLADPLP